MFCFVCILGCFSYAGEFVFRIHVCFFFHPQVCFFFRVQGFCFSYAGDIIFRLQAFFFQVLFFVSYAGKLFFVCNSVVLFRMQVRFSFFVYR